MVMTAMRPQQGMTISRALVDGAADPNARTIAHIVDATEACDYAGAAVIAFARARCGEGVPAEIVAPIVAGIRDITVAASLCAIATGDRVAAFSACLRDRLFPDAREALPIETVMLYAAWRAGASVALLAPEARRLARRPVGPKGYALIYAVAKGIGDDNLLHATRHLRYFAESGSPQVVASLDRVLSCSIAELIDLLPATVPAQPAAIGYTVRLAPRAGRNDPCPCGSGQKFKRCCSDKLPAVTPSPVAGLSWDKYLTKGGDRMSADDVRGLPLRDLARVDLSLLADGPLGVAVERFTQERLFKRAARGADELDRRGAAHSDTVREQIIAEALESNDLETAADQFGRMKDPEKSGWHRLELALRVGERERAMKTLEIVAEEAVRKDDPKTVLSLAHTLLVGMPSLGILVARGCIRSEDAKATAELLRNVEDARDALNVPPGDAAWDIHAALNGDGDDDDDDDGEHAILAAEATALRGSLRDASGRLDQLERELRAKQVHLDQAMQAPAQSTHAPTPPSDPAERDRVWQLRSKVEELEGLVRAGNNERSGLRRQLAATSATANADRPAPTVSADDAREALVCEPVSDTSRDVALPSLSRRAHDAIAEAPSAVAAEALRTIGSLGAGDASAWRRVKQAKDMPRQVLMARIGIHHRLLFRVEARTLEVLDLVTRECLLATLKRMRSRRS